MPILSAARLPAGLSGYSGAVKIRTRPLAGSAAALTFGLLLTLSASAQVAISINGNGVDVSPSPLIQAGRVFVPLRGVFENLGATVVYSNGQINATGNGRDISLQIGSTQAAVNGQPETIDVAPFIVGASTYVPLRFVSQALGAGVSWDGNDRVVEISMAGLLLGVGRRRLLLGRRHVDAAAAAGLSLDARILGIQQQRVHVASGLLGHDGRILRRHQLRGRILRPWLRRRTLVGTSVSVQHRRRAGESYGHSQRLRRPNGHRQQYRRQQSHQL
jgi:Copper amine oxidase N-terminal domain